MSLLPNPTPCSTVALTISARNLKDMDVFSKSDPICVVYRYTSKAAMGRQLARPQWTEVGRTELIMNCLNPEFTKQIIVEYFFEEKQPLKFNFYDIDNVHKGLESQDFLGTMECDLAEIVSVGVFTKALGGLSGNCGTVTVACEEVGENQRDHLEMRCNAIKLDKKDFFGKSDPYLKFYRMNDDGSRVMVHKTEFLKKTLNPTWKPIEIKLSTLCSGDRTKDFWVECWDDNLQFEPDFIGSGQVNVGQLVQRGTVEIPLINEKKRLKKGKKYTDSGKLVIAASLFTIPTFLDYITGGTQLEFTVAIDFTASNQPPHDPSSLHYLSSRPNQYEVAIRAVLDICQYYNRTKQFEAYGFGAIVPGQTGVTHLFSLADPRPVMSNSMVAGVSGVMQAYQSCVRTVRFYGPTNFAHIVQAAARNASSYRNGDKYQVLLIVTDGMVCDMIPTTKAIVEAASLPMSIIIVGVGNADFDKMDELDGDNVRLSYGGRFAERDIVQFVPINEFAEKHIIIPENIMAALAKEVLAELPLQLTSYMRSRNIAPLPPQRQETPPPSYPKMENCHMASAPPIDNSYIAIHSANGAFP